MDGLKSITYISRLILFTSGESLKKTHLLESSSDIMNMEEGGTIFSGRTPMDYSKVGPHINLFLSH